MTIPKKIIVYYPSLNACLWNLAAANSGWSFISVFPSHIIVCIFFRIQEHIWHWFQKISCIWRKCKHQVLVSVVVNEYFDVRNCFYFGSPTASMTEWRNNWGNNWRTYWKTGRLINQTTDRMVNWPTTDWTTYLVAVWLTNLLTD